MTDKPDKPTYIVECNYNRIEMNTWIEQSVRPDGDYDLVGMCRTREYDAVTGDLVSDKTEPSGLTCRASWW